MADVSSTATQDSQSLKTPAGMEQGSGSFLHGCDGSILYRYGSADDCPNATRFQDLRCWTLSPGIFSSRPRPGTVCRRLQQPPFSTPPQQHYLRLLRPWLSLHSRLVYLQDQHLANCGRLEIWMVKDKCTDRPRGRPCVDNYLDVPSSTCIFEATINDGQHAQAL